MPPDIIEPIMAVTAMIAIGSFVLVGLKMRYQHKAKMLEQSKGGEDLERLADALDGLYEQAKAMHEEVGELQERLDFHERLLTKPKDGE